MSTRHVLPIFCLLMFTAASWAKADPLVPLTDQGQPRAVIVLPDEPLPLERKAAEELAEHLRLIAGAPLTTQTPLQTIPSGLTAIYIGRAADPALDAGSQAAGVNHSTFTLSVTPGRIDIRGLSDEGTLFGAYELLEQLGVRWFMPGDFGRVLPEQPTLAVRTQQTTQAPSFAFRRLQHIAPGNWARRARLGGDERPTGTHGFPGLPDRLFEEHPDLFSLIDGTRQMRQHCVSNPQVLERIVAAVRAQQQRQPRKYVDMGSRDGSGWCECGPCKALDGGVYDPTGNRQSMTDRYIWLLNRVLEELEPEYPDLHVVTYIYSAHTMPPAVVTPNPRIVAVFAPITLDRIRGMDNPMSPDRHVLRWLIDAWKEFNLNEMYYRGYYNNLACPQFPISQVDRIRHETPVFKEKGITAMRVEAIRPSWATTGLNLYLATRMMWDVNTDVDALLEDFYEKFHGPAAAPMKAYYEALDRAFTDTPYFAGSAYPYLVIFDAQRRGTMRGMLDEAAGLAVPGSVYGQRIAAVRLGWDRMEVFLDAMAARNRHDFAAALAHTQTFYELSDRGVAETLATFETTRERNHPRLIHWDERTDSPRSYFRRFFRAAIEQGHRRTVTEGQMIAPLAETWDFLLDPPGIGRMAGYHRPGRLGGNWQPIHTTAKTWSDQGLHYYKGIAWYRQQVAIPAEAAGQQVYLWFGGVDRLATVWLNGQLLGSSREPNEGLPGVPGSFRPFDLDATAAIRPGEENTVVVEIRIEQLAELGTGGIVAPVMFWSPKAPDWAP